MEAIPAAHIENAQVPCRAPGAKLNREHGQQSRSTAWEFHFSALSSFLPVRPSAVPENTPGASGARWFAPDWMALRQAADGAVSMCAVPAKPQILALEETE